MPLDATNRARAVAQFMRDAVIAGASLAGITKTDITAAVAATDDWIDTNQASFNTALPVNFRTNANLATKTFLFCYVAMRRAGRLRAEEDG